MTTPTPTPGGPSRLSRLRPGRRRLLIVGAAVLVAVVAVAAVLLWPDGDRRDGTGRGGPEAGLELTGGERGFGPGDERGSGPGGRGGDREGRIGADDDPLLIGTLVSVTADAVVVTPDGGADRTLRTDDDTRVRGADDDTVGDLRAGERVVVRVEGSGDTATATLIQVPAARVTGTVTALNGDGATVVAADGRTVTADLTALGLRPVVGDIVVLDGTTGPDGTTFVADGIEVLPKAS